MQVGTTKDQGLYNKPSAAAHPGGICRQDPTTIRLTYRCVLKTFMVTLYQILVIYQFIALIHGNVPGFIGHTDGKSVVVFLCPYSQSPQPLVCQPQKNLCNNLSYGQTQKSSQLFVMGTNTGRDIDVHGAHTVIMRLYTCRWKQITNVRRQEKPKF